MLEAITGIVFTAHIPGQKYNRYYHSLNISLYVKVLLFAPKVLQAAAFFIDTVIRGVLISKDDHYKTPLEMQI